MHPNTTPTNKPPALRRVGRFLRKALIFILRRFAIALVAIGLVVFALTHFSTHNGPNDNASPRPPADPFGGSPADQWAEGGAGITLPAATAVGAYSQSTVAADLSTVKQALVDARLDPQMLTQHDPSQFLTLIAPNEQSDLRQDIDGKFAWATQIDTAYPLDPHTPRVSGKMTFSSTVDSHSVHVLEVVTNYVWAYAFADGTVTIVHDQDRWRFYRPTDVPSGSSGLWLSDFQSYVSNMDCTDLDRGLLAPPQFTYIGGGGSGSDNNSLYDPNHSMDINSTC
jgi:hypothetical protein